MLDNQTCHIIIVFDWYICIFLKNDLDILPFLMDLTKTNGPVVHFNLSGRSYVFLNDPDDLKVSDWIIYYYRNI